MLYIDKVFINEVKAFLFYKQSVFEKHWMSDSVKWSNTN